MFSNLKQNMQNKNRVRVTMDAGLTGPYMVKASGKKGVYKLKKLRTKTVLIRKVNATQIKRFEEAIKIGKF